jgi:hypothetical protein
MELINNYPNVGMVTARPFRTPREFNTSSIEWASNNPEVTLEEGVFVPWEQSRFHHEYGNHRGKDKGVVWHWRRYSGNLSGCDGIHWRGTFSIHGKEICFERIPAFV